LIATSFCDVLVVIVQQLLHNRFDERMEQADVFTIGNGEYIISRIVVMKVYRMSEHIQTIAT
jgi:hypothetical protein